MKNDIKFKANLSQDLYFIRGICIALMVIGHVIGFNRNYGMRQMYNSDLSVLGWLQDLIITFHMPVFFIASGVAFVAFSNKDVSYEKFVRSKLARLFIPLICWAPIYFVFQSLYKSNSFSLFDIVNAVVYPYEIFWFLHALIFANFLAFICFKVSKFPLVYFLLSVALFILCLRLDNTIYIYCHWNIFYAFGVFIAPYLSKICLIIEKIPVNGLFILVSLHINLILITKHFLTFYSTINFPRFINGIIGFLLMYIVANLIKLLTLPEPLNKLLQSVANQFVYMGKISMIIYLFHGYFTRITIFMIKFFGLPSPIQSFVLVCFVGILGPLVIYNFLQTRSKMFMYSIGEAKLQARL